MDSDINQIKVARYIDHITTTSIKLPMILSNVHDDILNEYYAIEVSKLLSMQRGMLAIASADQKHEIVASMCRIAKIATELHHIMGINIMDYDVVLYMDTQYREP